MKAFSACNLIEKEMKPQNIFGKIFTPQNVYLNLLLPNEVYFRAKVLCDDVSSYSDERFNLDRLIEMLWVDFLEDVIEYQNIKETYKVLLDYDRGTPNVRLSHYQSLSVEEVPLYPIRKPSNEVEELKCKMKRKLVLNEDIM